MSDPQVVILDTSNPVTGEAMLADATQLLYEQMMGIREINEDQQNLAESVGKMVLATKRVGVEETNSLSNAAIAEHIAAELKASGYNELRETSALRQGSAPQLAVNMSEFEITDESLEANPEVASYEEIMAIEIVRD